MHRFQFIVFAFIFISCANLRNAPKYELGTGNYKFRQDGGLYRKVKIYVSDDSISIFDTENKIINVDLTQSSIYLKRSFDIDVMTVPFKYRPAHQTLPRQLTTDFNGNVYVGYRIDRFQVKRINTPVGWQKSYYHRGITMGIFGGIGSTNVTPWTTANRITDEYNGFIISRGLALMVAVNNLTVGTGVGFDYLTDRDKSIWIYQHKPWYGLTVGLNIN